MALPAAGNSLSLNQIHIEAGGTSGTTCSLNDSDIRGLTAGGGNTIPSGDETTIDIGDFFEASGTNPNVHTLVAGFQQTTFTPRSGSGTYTNYYGYMPFYGSPTSQNGSLTPTAFAKKNNDTILAIYKNTSTNNTGIHNKVFLRVDGAQTNAGWTSMNVLASGINATFYRTAAEQFFSGSNYSYWKWAYTSSIFSNNVSHTITFA